jgi:hypothetical protein
VASQAISSDLKARAGVRQTDGISILAASTNAEMDDDNDDSKKSKDSQDACGQRFPLGASYCARPFG